jgi:Halocarboxylic acid dehydrogenase DehI
MGEATMSIAAPSRKEVGEEEAEGAIKAVYGDIKATLRVPLVSLVFRLLAAYPDYLQLAWRQIKPNAQTLFFERQADSLRRRAVDVVATLGRAPAPADSTTADVLKTFHYVLPKLLLVITALRASGRGQYPNLEELALEAKRQIASGVPPDMPTFGLIDPETADEKVRFVFDDVRETLGVSTINSDIRALANWPDYLEAAWQSLKPILGTDQYVGADRELRAMANETVVMLPFRVEINPHVMRLLGLSEEGIDSVQGIIETAFQLVPKLLLNAAFLTAGAIGREAAQQSPYPPTVL